jgi:hypothetical protein
VRGRISAEVGTRSGNDVGRDLHTGGFGSKGSQRTVLGLDEGVERFMSRAPLTCRFWQSLAITGTPSAVMLLLGRAVQKAVLSLCRGRPLRGFGLGIR